MSASISATVPRAWPLYAPYDAIVVSASTPVLPDALRRAAQIGGRLVAIVGELHVQVLLVTRTDEDAFNTDVV